MKSRIYLFLLGCFLGLTAGWFLGQEQYRQKLDAAFMQCAGKVDARLQSWMGRTKSKSGESTPPISVGEKSTNQALNAKVPDTALYIREFVTLRDVQVQRDSQSPDRVTVSGKVANAGTKRLRTVEVIVFFLGPAGILHEANGVALDGATLEAASERAFTIRVSDGPREWTPGKFRVAVTDVSFAE